MLNDIIHLPLRLRSVFLWPFISWHLCSWRILSRLILDSLSRRTASRCDVTSASMVARSRKILLVVKLKCSLNEYLTYFAENCPRINEIMSSCDSTLVSKYRCIGFWPCQLRQPGPTLWLQQAKLFD